MNFCFARIVSLHVIYTIAIVVRIVLTNGFECDNVGKCVCSDVEYYEDYSNADCSRKELNIIPEGLQSAQRYVFEDNYLNTRSHDFRISWTTFLDTVNSTITFLDLSSNPLMDIPEWLFDERLADVSLLDLSKCQISSLSENAFSKLGNLHELFLTENPLGVLPVGLFRNQIKLYLIDLGSCELRQLEEDIFTPLSDLWYLYMCNNELEYLPLDFLKENPDMGRLFLDNNRLEYLPDDFLMQNPNMEELYLRNNKLEYLPLEFLEQNPNVENLYLDSNRLAYLPDDFLTQTPKMRKLNLGNNSLEYLPPNFLMKNTEMWKLTLSLNKIKIMPFDWLFSLVQTLIRNKIKHVASDPSDRFIPPFDCFECLDCNFKIVEEFNEWIEKYDFNETEEFDIKKFKETSCNDGTQIVRLETVNDNGSDFNSSFSRDLTLAGIVTTLCVAAIGTLASITAVFIVIKRMLKTDHFKEERDESQAEKDIEIHLPDYDDWFMMAGELFRNIPAVDHRIITP